MCRIILAVIIFSTCCFAECRNSEQCGAVNNCVRCTETSDGKSGGEVTILSSSSNPVRVYSAYNFTGCIPCSCGDGVTDDGEECDDNNHNNEDGCNLLCKSEYCGDGFINARGEECDDGNTLSTDSCVCRCDGPCKPGEKTVGKNAKCGDAFVNPATEQCDKGEDLNGTPASFCSKTCQTDVCLGTSESIALLCGNNIRQCTEACDLGLQNGVVGSGCSKKCINECDDSEAKPLLCGNGKIDCDEGCDLGALNGVVGSGCSKKCIPECEDPEAKPLLCGNSKVDCDEQCDDGNKDETDKCDNKCKLTCEFYRLKYLGSTGGKMFKSTDLDVSQNTCLQQIWGDYGNITQVSNNLADDTVYVSFIVWANGYPEEAKTLVADKTKIYHYNKETAAGTKIYQDIYYGRMPGRIDHEVFFDAQCKPYFTLPENRGGICGNINFGIAPSPISLEIEGRVDQKWKLAQFELEPGNFTWVTWKASKETPLLVYDPEHTGKISSGSQLFGNYTKLDNYSNVSLKDNTNNYRWKNGYEALAKLDLNGDGEVSGTELEPLGLWFDENRNAISEPGEVRKVTDTEVLSLSYTPDKVARNGDIYVISGYQRLVNGTIESGSSVDWHSQTFRDQSDLLASLADKTLSSNPKLEAAPASANDKSNFTGYWLWKSNGALEDIKPLGLLHLYEDGNSIKGHSFVEEPLEKNAKGYRSHVMTFDIEGVKAVRDGKSYIDFTVTSKDGVKTTSSASIGADGKLLGESKLLIKNPDSEQPTELSYNWSAKRMELKKAKS